MPPRRDARSGSRGSPAPRRAPGPRTGTARCRCRRRRSAGAGRPGRSRSRADRAREGARPASSAQSARVPGPIASIRKQSSPVGAAERHRARQNVARRVKHEELPRHAGLDRPGRDAEQRVRPDRLGPGDPTPHRSRERRAGHAPIPIRSWSESAVSARAFAIACTAAAAPEIVVMHGTRAASAASRMR